jgi:hypothetical protein
MRAKEFLSEKKLSPADILKYPNLPKDRLPTFLEKIIMKSPFTLANGEQVVIDPNEFERIADWFNGPRSTTLKMNTIDGDLISLSALEKTKEFGGEDAGQREKKEQGQIEGIAQELEDAKNGQPYIELIVGNSKIHAARVGKTLELVNNRAPKSDMTVYDENNNPVAWVSLKASNAGKWGGFTHLIGTSTDIKSWIDKIKEITGGELSPGQSFGHHLTDDTVKNKIVFGKDFGTPKFGISNVNAVLIGWTHIKKNGKKYVLSADKIYPNGITPTGMYEPYLAVRYTLGRTDVGLKNARAEANTKNEKRKVQWLDSEQAVKSIVKHSKSPPPPIKQSVPAPTPVQQQSSEPMGAPGQP